MILEPYQLEKYKTTMSERIIEISKKDHLIHGYMIYQCGHCHNIYVMWLEKGLEDPTDDQKTGGHKPVPFGIICPACGGTATHILWSVGKDSLGKNYKSYQKYVDQTTKLIYRNFFWNDPTADCGVPIIFEPDYINTLPDEEYEEFNNAMNVLASNGMIDDDRLTLLPMEMKEEKVNRERRRHGAFGKDGYKRPRSNKKLYEY